MWLFSVALIWSLRAYKPSSLFFLKFWRKIDSSKPAAGDPLLFWDRKYLLTHTCTRQTPPDIIDYGMIGLTKHHPHLPEPRGATSLIFGYGNIW